VAETFQGVSFTNTILSGWTYIGGVVPAFTCPQAGVYLVQYSAEAEKGTRRVSTQPARRDTIISLRVFNLTTGLEIPGSESSVILSVESQPVIVSKSFLATLVAGDEIQFQFTGNDTSATLIAGVGAAAYQPSISCTIIRIQ
jgi:hypothetical protein